MSQMIALVHESAMHHRGIGLGAKDTQALSNEINVLAALGCAPPRRPYKDSRIIEQVRKHVAEGVVLVSSRTHADPIDLPRVLAEYDRIRALCTQPEEAKTTPAPRPAGRKFREVVFKDGYTHRMLDGQLQYWNEQHRVWEHIEAVCVHDVEAFVDLRDNPYEKEETLEEVVLDWWRLWDGTDGESARADLCTRLRAWLAAQEPKT
jgi:hypothetical protein